MITPEQLRDLVFQLLYDHMQGDPTNETPEQFVGTQGDDAIIVMQKDGHIGLRVVDAVMGQ